MFLGLSPARAEKLVQGAVLCPLEAHLELSALAEQHRGDDTPEAKAHNLPLSQKFTQLMVSQCVTIGSTVTVELTGNTSNKAEGFSEVIYQGRRLWVSTGDLTFAKGVAD